MSIAKPARVGMAPSTAGNPDGDKLISDIKSSLDSIYENKVTVAGHKVHAVSPSKLEQLERRIDRALAHQGTSGASPNELIALHEQVAELRSENDRIKQRMADAMKAESEALALRNEAASKFEAAMKDNEHAKNELGQLKKSLQSSMSKASTDLKSAQEALKKSEARFDPDAALALNSAKTEAAAQVKLLNSELAKVNRQLASKQEDFNKAVASMKAQTESFEAAKAATAQFKNALHDASTGTAKLEFSPAIEALLGKQACETLQGWHSIAFDNVKDRAFVGMKALSRHKNGLLSAIGKLFHAVYEWCKTQTVSARKALVPWMDMVMRDLLAAKLRAVSFYRDELKKLQVIADEQRAKRDKALKDSGKEPKQGKGDWFSSMWFYGYAIVLRVRRRAAPPTKKIAYGSVGALRAAKTWFIEMSKFQWAVYSELYTTGQLIPDGGKARVQFDTVWPSVVRSFWSAWPLECQPLPEDEVVFEVPEDEAPEAKPL